MKTRIIALRNKNILPTFSTCLVDYFQKDLNSVLVKWNCQNELFILEEDKDGYELRVNICLLEKPLIISNLSS